MSPQFEYERVPFVDDTDNTHLEKPRLPLSVSPWTGTAWQSFCDAPAAAVISAGLISLAVATVIISSFTMHIPGSYVQVLSIHQANSPRPGFKDAWNGPIEIAGSYRCGTHPSEARALNCTFDIMNYGFLGAECYYKDMAEKALAEGPWKWYLDRNGTTEIPADSFYLSRAVEVYVHWSYHVSHCKYAFEQLRKAREDDNFLIPQELASEGHTRHCQKVLADPEGKSENIYPPYETSTWVRSVYNPCIKLSEANRTFLDIPQERDSLF